MNKYLIKQPVNRSITRDEFLADVECLFQILESSYGLYHHFGQRQFLTAKASLTDKILSGPYDFETALSSLQGTFAAFIRDGHFRIGAEAAGSVDPGYAVQYTHFHGMDMIRCRKFYFDTPAEEQELLHFSRNYGRYQNDKPLIIDLRDNAGGSDIYIWDFITGLFGAEPDYPCKFVQNYSELFRAYAHVEEQGTSITESDGVIIRNRKPVYILINENTASSAESAVAFFKTVENTVTVGTHTAGCFTCGNCMTVYLPHSHIPVYFGTGMVLYEKTRNIDAEGGFQADMTYEEFLRNMRS